MDVYSWWSVETQFWDSNWLCWEEVLSLPANLWLWGHLREMTSGRVSPARGEAE